MANCPKCGGQAKLWNRHVFTGVCANCLKRPKAEKRLTNRQYKSVGLFCLFFGGTLVAVNLGFGFEFKEAGPLILFVASALVGVISFVTKPLRLVCLLGPVLLVSGLLADMILDGDLREDWIRLMPMIFGFMPWLMHCMKAPIGSPGDTVETTDDLEGTDLTQPRFKSLDWAVMLFSIIVIAAGFSWPLLSDHFASENARGLPTDNSIIAYYKTVGADIETNEAGRVTTVRHYGDINDLKDLQTLRDLAVLQLGGSKITDASLVGLKEFPQLESLILNGTQITDEGLGHLKGLTSLEFLQIDNSWRAHFTNAGLKHLTGLTTLKELRLNADTITDAGLLHLTGLTNLEDLNLDECHITGAELDRLQELSNLTHLSLENTQVTDTALVHLKHLTDLQELNLDSTKITGAGLVSLAGLKNLRELALFGTNVADADLVHLKAMTKLEKLNLANTQVTPAGVAAFQQELPNCKISY